MVEHQHHHLAAQHMAQSPLDTLAHTSQYAGLQFHQNRHVLPNGKAIVKPHRLPYASGPIAPRHQREMLHERSGRGTTAPDSLANTVSEFGLTCEYIRERKKRGKASRKDLAQQQAATAAGGSGAPKSEESSTPQSSDKAAESIHSGSPKLPEGHRSLPEPSGRSASIATTRAEMDAAPIYQNRTMSMSAIDSMPEAEMHHHMTESMQSIHPMQPPRIQTQGLPMHNPMPEYTSMEEYHRNLTYQSPLQMMQPGMHPVLPSHGHGIEFSDSPYSMMSPQSAHTQAPANTFRIHEEASNMGYMAHSPVDGSPGWMLPSPSATMYPGAQHQNPSQQLRYPVLQPLVPHLANVMPISLACDLLELYFQSSSTAFMQPVSPYVLGYVFRKRSFLRTNNPRVCSPALLASMLWIGCLTSESPYLSSSPSARSQLSEKLINLTISLLKPLVHQTPGGSDASPTAFNGSGMVSGVTMGGFAGAPGGLDDIATYMHLAIVISASEYKAASLRWWNAAWSLARELKLGKEVPVTPPPEPNDADAPRDLDAEHIGAGYSTTQHTPGDFTEEQREERRRIWWLLFTVDRRGPAFECTGHSIFGFFLPLMTILGEITDLYHARNHPRFGTKTDWDHHALEISQQLVVYGQSLKELRSRAVNEANAEHEPAHPGTPSGRSVNSTMSRAQESLMHAKIVEAYGTHLMHTLHILLNGKWDPISLLDDNDLWISSQSFVDATGHAVSAAEALNEILEYDPDLSFMPFFFGIYLLQGSFLLLLIADKLQGEASPNIVRACEVIVRAHEACIVTLNTEYQRNFRKVMRSALQQVRGRGMDEHAEPAQQRRREMLSLYRWSGDGTGLAL
ncbi:Xylanolytic transcriptional activator [Alternaria alternata]|nr:Xylanolytic transcriptional activator [Alternaria alternata]